MKPKSGSPQGIEAIKGMLEGLGQLVHKLEEFGKEAPGKAFSFGTPGREIKGVYGFTFKIGTGSKSEPALEVEPFGNVRPDARDASTAVTETREPAIDVFDEGDEIVIVAEMPGVDEKSVKAEVEGDVLDLRGSSPARKYEREILLPAPVRKSSIKISALNGIIEIRLRREHTNP